MAIKYVKAKPVKSSKVLKAEKPSLHAVKKPPVKPSPSRLTPPRGATNQKGERRND